MQAKSNYFAGTTTANQATSNNVNFNNASVVFYNRLNKPRGASKTEGWLSLNFGISYNRTNNFYANTAFGGNNTNNSIADYFKELADADPSTTYDNSIQNWGYNQYLIDSVGYNKRPVYRSNVAASASSPTNQLTNTTTVGGQTSFNFSMGANYSNQLYLGIGIAVTNLRYNTSNTFTETGYQFADGLNYTTQYQVDQITKGNGASITLGAIYKPVDALRLGFSFTTPTWYTIDDDYSESLTTQYKGSNKYSDGPADYPLSYSLRTPLKVSGGAAVFFQKFGFLSADIEYLDYSSIHVSNSSTTSDGYDNSNSGYNPSQDNSDIKKLYRSTVNAHLGGEARLSSAFALRAGYSIQGSPYVNTALQSNITTVSGGIGFRTGSYYVDATYANVTGSQNIYPYVVSATDSPYAHVDKTYNNVFLTLGMRF